MEKVLSPTRVRKTNLGYKVYHLMSNKMFLSKVSETLLDATKLKRKKHRLDKFCGVFLYYYTKDLHNVRGYKTINLVKFLETIDVIDLLDDDGETPDDEIFGKSFKDIKKLNDRAQISYILNAFIGSLLWGRPLEDAEIDVNRFMFMIPKKAIKEINGDWFALARRYDCTGGEPKSWYEMNEEWNLTTEAQKTLSLVFIYSMWLYEDLCNYFDAFMDEFLDEAERLEL